MAVKAKQNPKEKIVLKALDLAAERGWNNTSLRDIAEASKLSLSDLHDHFEDKTDILVTFGRMIDRQVLESMGELEKGVSARDKLFDILMERYDVLNQYRDGLVAILDSFQLDPKQAIISMPHLCRSMTWMLEAAGIETGGITGAAKVAGLTGIYIKGLKVWKNDESTDLSKTMASLDRDLGRAEQLTNFLSF